MVIPSDNRRSQLYDSQSQEATTMITYRCSKQSNYALISASSIR